VPEALDDVDRAILALLRADGRRPVADVAKRVGLSAAPVRRRIARLEARGVITGYTVLVGPDKLGQRLEALTELRFAGNSGIEEITAAVEGLPGVRGLFITAGDPDAIIWLQVDNIAELKRVTFALRRNPKIAATKTLMVLDSWSPSSGSS
jgi:Lrp/AsnC family transcriptional regulator, leucine-responsive regulatory protein